MGLVNQGWFVRCDECGQADSGSIDGRIKAHAIADALRTGWFKRRKLWFCSEACFEEWSNS